MNILIEIGHPAHVLKFSAAIKILEENNHKIFVVTKNIPTVIHLLSKLNIPFTVIGTKKDNLIAKGFLQLWYNLRCFLIIKGHQTSG